MQPIDHGRTVVGNHPLTSAGQRSHIANSKTGPCGPKAGLDHEEVTAAKERREAAARRAATCPKGIGMECTISRRAARARPHTKRHSQATTNDPPRRAVAIPRNRHAPGRDLKRGHVEQGRPSGPGRRDDLKPCTMRESRYDSITPTTFKFT